MLSRRFFAWVSVGVISAATIPAIAAPHLARLAARKPLTTTPAQTPGKAKAPVVRTLASKAPAVKTTAVAHKVTAVKKPVAKLTSAQKTTPVVKHLAARPVAHKALVKKTTVSHKALVRKPVVAAHKPLVRKTAATPASTAKKLLH